MASLKQAIFITTAFFLFSLPAFGADEPLEAGTWPTTVADTVRDILSGMSDKDKQIVRSTQKVDLIKFHHGWGTGIRNHYGLWRGNTELIKSACGKPCHPDDASMKIIEAVWVELQKK